MGFSASTFVGRESETAELKVALEDALAGRGRLVMLTGEAGIGKTRTAREFAAQAREGQVKILWGLCHEAPGAPPYWPWTQVLRACVLLRAPEEIRSAIGPGIANIAQVVPELSSLVMQPSLSDRTDSPEASRFKLFDSVSNFLKSMSHERPLLILLDDLHRADRPSLLLLEFVAQGLFDSRVMILGTYRDGEVTPRHPLAASLVELARVDGFRRISLPRLAKHTVAQFIEAATGDVASSGLVDVLYGRSDGNPLFMNEMLRLIAGELGSDPAGAMSPGNWKPRIPDTVRDVIKGRLNRLSERCSQALTVAAIIGKEFAFEELQRAIDDIAPGVLLETIDEALEARLIETIPGQPGHYQFSHILIRDSLEADLSQIRRARLHGLVGNALEQFHAGNLEAHATMLAYHFSEARLLIGNDKMVRYSILAGQHTLANYAWEQARAHFQEALAARGTSGLSLSKQQPTDFETAEMLFGLGLAQKAIVARHEQQEAVDNLGRAFDYYVQAGATLRALAVTLSPFPTWPFITGIGRMLARGLELVPSDSHDAGRILSSYLAVLGLQEPDYELAQKLFQQGLVIARRHSDAGLEMSLLANVAQWVDMPNLRFEDGLERSLAAIELAPRVNNPYSELIARSGALLCIIGGIGNLDQASLQADAMLPIAIRLRERSWQAIALGHRSNVSLLRGEWDSARAFSDRSLGFEPKSAQFLGPRVLMEYETGNFAEGEEHLKALIETSRLVPPGGNNETSMPSVVAVLVDGITGTADGLKTAEAGARAVLASQRSVPLHTLAARVTLGLIAAHRGDVTAVEEHYAALKNLRGTLVMWLPCSTDRVLGVMAQAMHRQDLAAEDFERAISLCRKGGYLPQLARSCHDYATLLARGNAGPSEARQRALALVNEAVATSAKIGMTPLLRDATALLERLGGAVRIKNGAPRYPAGLTPREVEVLRLIAGGKSNRQISQELFISYNTAVNHVKSILEKTGSSNRAEVAAFAVRHGLDHA
ncbi:MAG: AAA family ATPase [Chloroflexi bacterium]|nr:AAA family ATPase [Chloroflexota bacterium]